MAGSKKLRVGVAGIGTVGGGLLRLFAQEGARLNQGLELVAISARNRTRKRDVDISRYQWVDDPVELAANPDIDIFVELIGGSDGPAKRAVETALQRGAHVVTANKALIAIHGAALAELSEAKGGALAFEAAVGGGVPMVKAVKESLAGCRVGSAAGILNGTCNYLLTEMENSGRSFADVLADAQRLGYAEADPTMDVGGFDAAHKIAILGAIAFGARPDFDHVKIEGVEGVTLHDIRLAGKLGYRIKLIAKAERIDSAIAMHVGPALLALDHPLANVGGALNALVVDAEPAGELTFIGRGAGEGPTAASVAADLIDIAEGRISPAFGAASSQLEAAARAQPAERGRFYMRLLVQDRPGVVAALSDCLGRESVSIESFLQMPSYDAPVVPIVLTTQSCDRAALDAAAKAIESLEAVTEPPRIMPIEEPGGRSRFWS
jgi:homoserine dehydrogenase